MDNACQKWYKMQKRVDLERHLHRLASSGKVSQLEDALSKIDLERKEGRVEMSFDINAGLSLPPENYNLLELAVEEGQVGVVEILLRRSDVRMQVSLLYTAAEAGHLAVVQRLVQHGMLHLPPLVPGGSVSNDVLGFALSSGQTDIAEYLHEAGKVQLGEADLDNAIVLDMPSAVEWICRKSPSLANDASKDSTTPLLLASELGHSGCVEVLLKLGAEPHYRTSVWKSWIQPIHAASQNGNTKTVELLIEKGANVNSFSLLGPPIWCASTVGAARCLKDHGARGSGGSSCLKSFFLFLVLLFRIGVFLLLSPALFIGNLLEEGH